MSERKSALEQAGEILGLGFGLLSGDSAATQRVQEGLADEAAKLLGKRLPSCAHCGGELDDVETADGSIVQVCAAACRRKK